MGCCGCWLLFFPNSSLSIMWQGPQWPIFLEICWDVVVFSTYAVKAEHIVGDISNLPGPCHDYVSVILQKEISSNTFAAQEKFRMIWAQAFTSSPCWFVEKLLAAGAWSGFPEPPGISDLVGPHELATVAVPSASQFPVNFHHFFQPLRNLGNQKTMGMGKIDGSVNFQGFFFQRKSRKTPTLLQRISKPQIRGEKLNRSLQRTTTPHWSSKKRHASWKYLKLLCWFTWFLFARWP